MRTCLHLLLTTTIHFSQRVRGVVASTLESGHPSTQNSLIYSYYSHSRTQIPNLAIRVCLIGLTSPSILPRTSPSHSQCYTGPFLFSEHDIYFPTYPRPLQGPLPWVPLPVLCTADRLMSPLRSLP